MKKLAAILTLYVMTSIIFCVISAGQNIEQVICTDNSVYEGFISEQKSGISMSVFAEKATIVLNADNIRTVLEETISVSELSPEWRNWVKENLPNDAGSITLESFSYGNDTFNKVYVLERGSYITFIDLSKREYTIPWDKVLCTRKSLRPEHEFSGLNDVIITKDGDKYTGQLLEQNIGKFVKIRTDEGNIISISPSELKYLQVEPLNPEMPIFSQARFIDIITVDGKIVEGIITAREFGKNLQLRTKDGRTLEYPLNKVSIYAKKLNTDFMSYKDIVINNGDIYLNGKPATLDSLVKNDIGYVIHDNVDTVMKIGEQITVGTHLDDPYAPIFIVKASFDEVPRTNAKGKIDPKAGVDIITIAKYRDIIESPIRANRTVSPLKNTSLEFILSEPGIYVVIIPGRDKGLVIKAE